MMAKEGSFPEEILHRMHHEKEEGKVELEFKLIKELRIRVGINRLAI